MKTMHIIMMIQEKIAEIIRNTVGEEGCEDNTISAFSGEERGRCAEWNYLR